MEGKKLSYGGGGHSQMGQELTAYILIFAGQPPYVRAEPKVGLKISPPPPTPPSDFKLMPTSNL